MINGPKLMQEPPNQKLKRQHSTAIKSTLRTTEASSGRLIAAVQPRLQLMALDLRCVCRSPQISSQMADINFSFLMFYGHSQTLLCLPASSKKSERRSRIYVPSLPNHLSALRRPCRPVKKPHRGNHIQPADCKSVLMLGI